MKKQLLVLTVISTFFLNLFGAPFPILAQEETPPEPTPTQTIPAETPTPPPPVFDFNRAYNDYTFNYNLYRETHAAYVKARQAYLNYKTLTSKNEAFDKTLKMLQSRSTTLRTYLTAIRMKLAETTGISNYDQNVLYLKLDEEINWYQTHLETLPSAGTLEDLVKLSQKEENQYEKTESLIYQTLITILSGKETTLREEIHQSATSLEEKIAAIRVQGDKDTTLAERWLLEAKNRLTRSQEKEDSAKSLLENLRLSERNKAQVYNKAQAAIQESHQYLKEAVLQLKELIREVKSAD